MARKVKTEKSTAAPKGAAVGKQVDEAAIIAPERTIEIAGTEVTVREFTFMDSLTLNREIAAVVDGLAAMPGAADGEPDFANLVSALASNPDASVRLVAASCQMPADWVAGLRGAAGETLLQVFWVVNAPFFINRLLTAWEFRRAAKATDPSDSASSSPPSSPTGTTPSG